MIRLPLESIRGDNGPGIAIENGGDGDVVLDFEPEAAGETSAYRSLTPAEARALAAMLLHFADEVER